MKIQKLHEKWPRTDSSAGSHNNNKIQKQEKAATSNILSHCGVLQFCQIHGQRAGLPLHWQNICQKCGEKTYWCQICFGKSHHIAGLYWEGMIDCSTLQQLSQALVFMAIPLGWCIS